MSEVEYKGMSEKKTMKWFDRIKRMTTSWVYRYLVREWKGWK